MGSAYRLHRRTCYTKKEPPRRISEVLKVAATSSPTTVEDVKYYDNDVFSYHYLRIPFFFCNFATQMR